VHPPAFAGRATTPAVRRGSDVPAPTEQAPVQAMAVANDPTTAGEAWPLAVTPQPVFTRCARLLFLVNLLLGDGLYPDFTRPAERGFPGPLWPLLALLGIALAGTGFRRDPLHAALETGQRGRGQRSDRSRSPLADPPLRLAGGGCARAACAGSRKPLSHAGSRAIACHCAGAWPSALAIAPALIGRQLWQAHGNACVWLSAAEIVVEYPLDEHPVAWRLAGLDRDRLSAKCRTDTAFRLRVKTDDDETRRPAPAAFDSDADAGTDCGECFRPLLLGAAWRMATNARSARRRSRRAFSLSRRVRGRFRGFWRRTRRPFPLRPAGGQQQLAGERDRGLARARPGRRRRPLRRGISGARPGRQRAATEA
jgi:hypothetical protein